MCPSWPRTPADAAGWSSRFWGSPVKWQQQCLPKLSEMGTGDSHCIRKQNWPRKSKKVNHTPSFRCSAMINCRRVKNKMTPDVSRSSQSADGQSAGVRPLRNLLYWSCHNVLFLRYLKKLLWQWMTQNEASCYVSPTSTFVDPRENGE